MELIPAFRYKSSQKKVKLPKFQKELPLVAFLEQETFTFFAPGFSLHSGLGVPFSESYFMLKNKFNLLYEIRNSFNKNPLAIVLKSTNWF